MKRQERCSRSVQVLGLCLGLSLLGVCLVTPCQAQKPGERGVGRELLGPNVQGKEQSIYPDGSYALLVGVSDYDYWDDLIGVDKDIAKVSATLKAQGFTVEIAAKADLKAERLKQRLAEFITKYGMSDKTKDRRLLIYFAGHGWTEPNYNKKVGYFVPSDAPRPNAGYLEKFREQALQMADVEALAKKIRAKHVLFVFDSCFSAAMLSDIPRTRSPSFDEPLKEEVLDPAREFLAAGSETQRVSDNSLFCPAFLKGIQGAADHNADGYVTQEELAIYVVGEVTYKSKGNQTPQAGKMKMTETDRGDFIFFPNRSDGITPSLSVTPRQTTEPTFKDRSRSRADEARELLDDAEKNSRRGNYLPAIDGFTKVTGIDKTEYRAWAGLGWAYYRLQDYQLALYHYGEAIRLAPEHRLYYEQRAKVYQAMKQYKKAEADLQKAQELKPKN